MGGIATMGSLHVCPAFVTLVPVPVPHVGGPVIGTGVNVMISGMPAALLGDMAVCAGPPDSVVLGNPVILAGGVPLARINDLCSHGGMIVVGVPTVVDG